MSELSYENMDNEDIELQLLLEAVYLKYGYDFRQYNRAHLKRRVKARMAASNFENISLMLREVLYNPSFFDLMLPDFSISVSDMFRDPPLFIELRSQVVPILKTYPNVKIWHAGCASGEEVHSLAILLKEEGLYKKTQIYATDLSEPALKKAKDGVYSMDRIKKYTSNYQKSGGVKSFADYYTANYDAAIFDKALRERVVFARHNLAVDSVFGEMHMILCRNVLIYFNKDLQKRALQLFLDSLIPGGFLCLGTKETILFSGYEDDFEIFSEKNKIYRKKLFR